MKKTLASILTLLFLISALAISASAAGLTATVSNKSCARGSTVTVDVSLSQATTVKSGAVEVIYDSSILEFVSAKWKVDALIVNYDQSKNLGAFAFNGIGTVSGVIFSVTFKVKDSAPLGNTAVNCNVQLKDASDSPISLTNTAGSINVTCKHDFSKKDNAYPASPASCTSAATYYYSCSVCGEKGSRTYTSGNPTSHTYDKQVAEEKFLVAPVNCVEKAEYYYSCQCGAIGTEKFEGDASWSHSFSEGWFIGTSGHWHACIECGQKKDSSGHIAGDNGICTVCSFVIEANDEHVHIFGEEWKKNDVGHWHECSCGLKESLDFHNWDEGTVTSEVSETAEGEMKFVCTVCGEEKTESIPKVEPEVKPDEKPVEKPTETPDEKPDEDPNTNDTAVSNGPSPILVAAITLGSVAVIEVIAFVIYKAVKTKKSTEPKANEEDSDKEENETAE